MRTHLGRLSVFVRSAGQCTGKASTCRAWMNRALRAGSAGSLVTHDSSRLNSQSPSASKEIRDPAVTVSGPLPLAPGLPRHHASTAAVMKLVELLPPRGASTPNALYSR